MFYVMEIDQAIYDIIYLSIDIIHYEWKGLSGRNCDILKISFNHQIVSHKCGLILFILILILYMINLMIAMGIKSSEVTLQAGPECFGSLGFQSLDWLLEDFFCQVTFFLGFACTLEFTLISDIQPSFVFVHFLHR